MIAERLLEPPKRALVRSETMRKRITKRAVEAISPGARPELLWDTGLPGFGVKVTPRGARIYVL